MEDFLAITIHSKISNGKELPTEVFYEEVNKLSHYEIAVKDQHRRGPENWGPVKPEL